MPLRSRRGKRGRVEEGEDGTRRTGVVRGSDTVPTREERRIDTNGSRAWIQIFRFLHVNPPVSVLVRRYKSLYHARRTGLTTSRVSRTLLYTVGPLYNPASRLTNRPSRGLIGPRTFPIKTEERVR